MSRSLLPKLRDFSADLLIFSSGFDAHYDDLYHFLTEDDFHWLTREIMEACSCRSSCSRTGEQEQHSAGGLCRVVSVLEGGYSLSTTTPLPRKASSKRGNTMRNCWMSVMHLSFLFTIFLIRQRVFHHRQYIRRSTAVHSASPFCCVSRRRWLGERSACSCFGTCKY